MPLEEDMISKAIPCAGTPLTVFGYGSDDYFKDIGNHAANNPLLIDALVALPAGSVILDIGANIGAYAALAARLAEGSEVHAFEPSLRTYRALERTMADNGLTQCRTYRQAIGAFDGEVAFAHEPSSSNNHIELGAQGVAGAETVPITRLDTFVREHGLERLDLIKIDVEGFEEDVLDGGMETLARFKPRVVMEFSSYGIVALKNGSPLDLGHKVLDLAGSFEAALPWGAYRVHDRETLRHFIYANMVNTVSDIVFTPR